MSGNNMRDNQLKAPPEVQNAINWLRNKAQIKVKTGGLAGKRHDYFKGKSAIKALLSPAYAKLKHVPPQPTTRDQAREVLHSWIPFTFFLRVQRGQTLSPQVKAIQINPQQLFSPEEYYVWLVDPNPVRQLVLAATMVVVVLAGVMFPLWPVKMRIGVWYLSVAVLALIALFFGLAIVRLFLWLATKLLVSPGIWLFPNLFADVGFVDSFIPLWAWDVPPPSKKKSKRSSKPSTGDPSSPSSEHKSTKKKRKDASKKAPASDSHGGHSHSHGAGGHSHSHGEDGSHGNIVVVDERDDVSSDEDGVTERRTRDVGEDLVGPRITEMDDEDDDDDDE
ncbi:hypothetical protein JCM10212_004691 [Sporobolomyces blumeae]